MAQVLNNKFDILAVDINGMGYAAMYQPSLANLKHKGFQTSGMHGGMTSLLSHMALRPGAVPFVLWDNRAEWRYELYPEYKGTRSSTEEKIAIKESYKRQTPYIFELLMAMGIPQVSCGGREADDLCGQIVREIDPAWKMELVAKDTDWWQGISESNVWFSTGTKVSIDLAALTDPMTDRKEGHFVSTQEYLQAKALAGDASDNIPGIEKVGILTAVKIMRKHGGTIHSYWDAVDSGSYKPKGVVENRMVEQASRDTYARNIKLMDWSLAPEADLAKMSLIAGKPDWALAQAIADEFGMKKVLAHAREVLAPWEESGWGDAVTAVDAALHAPWTQPFVKRGVTC